jgi:hypothetical protein
VDAITAADAVVVTITASLLAEAVVAPRGEDEDGVALRELVVGAASNPGAKLSDWIRTYNRVVKSLRSTLSASPELQDQKKEVWKSQKTRGPF